MYGCSVMLRSVDFNVPFILLMKCDTDFFFSLIFQSISPPVVESLSYVSLCLVLLLFYGRIHTKHLKEVWTVCCGKFRRKKKILTEKRKIK